MSMSKNYIIDKVIESHLRKYILNIEDKLDVDEKTDENIVKVKKNK
jgi:hypothetical protein